MSKESEAIKAEATNEVKSIGLEFEGQKYQIRIHQPSPKAMEYLGDYVTKGSLYAVPFIRELIGQDEWDRWCDNHTTDSITDMLHAVNDAAIEAKQGNG